MDTSLKIGTPGVPATFSCENHQTFSCKSSHRNVLGVCESLIQLSTSPWYEDICACCCIMYIYYIVGPIASWIVITEIVWSLAKICFPIGSTRTWHHLTDPRLSVKTILPVSKLYTAIPEALAVHAQLLSCSISVKVYGPHLLQPGERLMAQQLEVGQTRSLLIPD